MIGRSVPLVLALAGAALLASCKGGPAPRPAPKPLEAAQRKAIVDGMNKRLQARYGAWSNKNVESVLRRLIAKVGGGTDPVLLNSDRALFAAGLFGHIYVSKGALKHIQYENELAFLFARETVLSKSGVLEERLYAAADQGRDLQKLDLFDKDGLYDLPRLTHMAADREGVKILYGLSYDPRGAVSLLQRWTMDPALVQERLAAVRDEIAKLSPMRDPMINGPLIDELRAALSSKGSGDARRPTVNPRMGWKK